MKFNILFTLAIALLFTACGDGSKAKTATTPVPKEVTEISAPSAIMTSIRMQKWELVDYQYKGTGTLVQVEKKPYVIFRDGRVSGFGGCNVFSGKYVEGASMGLNLTVNINAGSCENGAGEEAKFISILGNIAEYSLSEDKSKLKLTGTAGVLNFILKSK